MIRRNPGRWRQAAREDWAAIPLAVWALIFLLGLLAVAAVTAQVISLASIGQQTWAAELAWVLAGAAAGIATVFAGLRARGNPMIARTWLVYGLGAGCWAAGALIRAATPPGQESFLADAFFLCLPVCAIVTYARRVPRFYLFVLFQLDAIPVVLLVLALLLAAGRQGPGAVFSLLFTGLYVLLAANAVQMIGIHENPRRLPLRIRLYTVAFGVMGCASLFAEPHRLVAGDALAVWLGSAWTAGLLLLGVAGMGGVLRPAGFIRLLPAEKQGGPHAIPPAIAVLGLIVLLLAQPHPPIELRVFVSVSALLLLIRVYLLHRQDQRLIVEAGRSRARLADVAAAERTRAERLRLLAEITSRLRSLLLDELLPAFCGAAREMLGVPYAAVGLAAGGQGFTHFVTAAGEPGGGLPAGGSGGCPPAGLTALVPPAPGPDLRPERPVRLAGVTRQPEHAGFRPGAVPPGGFLAVPVTVTDPGSCVLYLAGKNGEFSREDESLAGLLATSGGHAIVNAGLYAESKRQQELLATQNERLRELDRLKDEFVALVSHELRTPLTSITGYVELLRDADFTAREEGFRYFTDVIDRNAHRLLHLVGDLLFLSRVQSGKLKMDFREAELAGIAASVAGAARPEATGRRIELALAAGPCPPAYCDPERIAQLLSNLVSNALKFTLPGGRVEVRLARDGDRARLEVADTGSGIPAADRERVFERFFRSSNAIQGAVPGTGLGLTISKAVVDAHGGTISVDSAEGGGTTFRVCLPLRPPG